MFFVYLLYSLKHNKTYVGQTNDLEKRLHQHNNTNYKTFTSKYRPWELIYTEEYPSRSEAMRREKWFKTGVGRDRIKEIKEGYISNIKDSSGS